MGSPRRVSLTWPSTSSTRQASRRSGGCESRTTLGLLVPVVQQLSTGQMRSPRRTLELGLVSLRSGRLTTLSLEARRRVMWERKDQLWTMERRLLTCLRCNKRPQLPFLTFLPVMILSAMLVLCNTLTTKILKKPNKMLLKCTKKKKKKKNFFKGKKKKKKKKKS